MANTPDLKNTVSKNLKADDFIHQIPPSLVTVPETQHRQIFNLLSGVKPGRDLHRRKHNEIRDEEYQDAKKKKGEREEKCLRRRLYNPWTVGTIDDLKFIF